MLNSNLAHIDCENWEEDTSFKEPQELYDFLKANKPREELVFSRGNLEDSSILVINNEIKGFIDLGEAERQTNGMILLSVSDLLERILEKKNMLNCFLTYLV